jgi:2-hydroxy-3-keto-5-methylthiopentenyl-1-phosphate phosphatase
MNNSHTKINNLNNLNILNKINNLPNIEKIKLKCINIKKFFITNSSNIELIVLSDFDRTITTGDSKECHEFMNDFCRKIMKKKLCTSPSPNNPDFRDEQHIRPIYYANFIKKLAHMYNKEHDTWIERHQAYIMSKFNETELNEEISTETNMKIRKDVNKTFNFALQNNIIVIIASAGIDNIIRRFFPATKILIDSHHITFDNKSIIENIEPKISDFHIEKEHLVDRMHFLSNKRASEKILVGIMIGDSEVDFKIMNDYPDENQCFIKVAFINNKQKLTQKYITYVNENCDIILNDDQESFEIIYKLLEILIKIRDSI